MLVFGALLLPQVATAASSPGAVHLEELTWVELRDRIAGGARTAILPVGGTEQNGPHIALGKHNARVRVLAGRIAENLGDALVAPVLAYVPEGSLDAPSGHLRFPGTLTVSQNAFESVLVSAALSLCLHGIRQVILIGDHGGYQANLARSAVRANLRAAGRCRVHALADYYASLREGAGRAPALEGDAKPEPAGAHVGLADTSLTMALVPAMVRTEALAQAAREGTAAGVEGDPTRARPVLGEQAAARIVAVSVEAIRRITGHRTTDAHSPRSDRSRTGAAGALR